MWNQYYHKFEYLKVLKFKLWFMLRFYVNFGQVFILRWLWILIKFECHYHTPKRDLYEKFFGSTSLWMIFFLSGHRLRFKSMVFIFAGELQFFPVIRNTWWHSSRLFGSFEWFLFSQKCNILLNCKQWESWKDCCLFLKFNNRNQRSIIYSTTRKTKN